MTSKKISVVIPLYNTEKFIDRCLESVTAQTHERLEIIVVDDGSTDGGAKRVLSHIERDGRIRLISHEKNLGLFRARLTGAAAATGDYLAFVDSDDYLSRDYLRSLLSRALECDSDMTVARLVHEDASGRRYIHNRYHFYDPGVLEGEAAREKYWEQSGYCFIWHTVWNKLYSRRLWEMAAPYLSEVGGHLVMCEDFLISSLLFCFVRRLAFTEYGRYYYYQHPEASTSGEGGYRKYRKNISDLIYAFSRAEELLRRACDFKYGKSLAAWRRLYKHFWRENITASKLSPISKRRLLSELELLAEGDTAPRTPSYFYTSVTDYDSRYEDTLDALLSPEVRAVSFDIFDTLITRPLYTPSDLFYLMNGEFERLRPEDTRLFSDLRIGAERDLRQGRGRSDEPHGDITLEEIYRELEKSTDAQTARKMQATELELELSLCRPRRSAKNLYDAVLTTGKPIFFTSDMYLPADTVREMLKKCGYGTGVLLLSRDEGATKADGELFSLLVKKSGCPPRSIIHIGDNWHSDRVAARRQGINAVFYPSAVACLEYDLPDIKTTHTGVCYTEASHSFVNYECGFDFLGTRTAFAMAALRLYDNPFETYDEHSEMNASPHFLGYYALGMHILGFTRWLTEAVEREGYSSLAFVSRDGFLPMQAYELMRRYRSGLPAASYAYTSRRAALVCELDPEDILSLGTRLNIEALSPATLVEMLSPMLRTENISLGVGAALPFGSRERFLKFAKRVLLPNIDAERLADYRRTATEYLERAVPHGSAMVDIGYSGRTQELIYRLTGVSADAFYLHASDSAYRRAERYGFRIFTFYDYTPSVTGAVRELTYSKFAPSAIGYKREGGVAVPVFESHEVSFPEKFLVTELQRQALLFVSDFLSVFGHRLSEMRMRNMEISLPLEYFVHTLTDSDARLFDCVIFEDKLWAGNSFSLSDAWRSDIAYHGTVPHYLMGRTSGSRERAVLEEYYRRGIDSRGAVAKLVFWLTHDRRELKRKLKRKLGIGGGA